MIHPTLITTQTEIRYSKLLQEAETERLLKRMKTKPPQLRAHILPGVGDFLIALGQKLKEDNPLGSY